MLSEQTCNLIYILITILFTVLAYLQVVRRAYFKISAGLIYIVINAFRIFFRSICSKGEVTNTLGCSLGLLWACCCSELMVTFVSEGLTM